MGWGWGWGKTNLHSTCDQKRQEKSQQTPEASHRSHQADYSEEAWPADWYRQRASHSSPEDFEILLLPDTSQPKSYNLLSGLAHNVLVLEAVRTPYGLTDANQQHSSGLQIGIAKEPAIPLHKTSRFYYPATPANRSPTAS